MLIYPALGNDRKGKISLLCWVLAIPLALVGLPGLAGALLGLAACLWLIPDRRIKRKLEFESSDALLN